MTKKGIPYIVYQNMSAEEKEVVKWRAEKEKVSRKLREAEKVVEAKKSRAHYDIVIAAKAVVAAWPTNRLAEAVRELDATMKRYNEAIE